MTTAYEYVERVVTTHAGDFFLNGFTNSHQSLVFSFGNQRYGILSVDEGGQFRDTRIIMIVCSLDTTTGLFVDPELHEIGPEFLRTGGTYDSIGQWVIGGSLFESFPMSKKTSAGSVMVLLNLRSTNTNFDFPGETLAIAMTDTGPGTFDWDIVRVFDTEDNTLLAASDPSSPTETGLIPPYLKGRMIYFWSSSSRLSAVPFKNGMLNYVPFYIREHDLNGTIIDHRYLMGQYVERSGGSFVAHDPFFVRETVSTARIKEYLPGWGVQIQDKCVRVVARGGESIILDVVDEVGLISSLDISSLTSSILASGWVLNEIHLARLSDTKLLVFVRQGTSVRVAEVFFNGTTLTLGVDITISSALDFNHPVFTVRENADDGVVTLSAIFQNNNETHPDDLLEFHELFPDLAEGFIWGGTEFVYDRHTDVFIQRLWFIDGSTDGTIGVTRDLWRDPQPWVVPFSWYAPANRGTYDSYQENMFHAGIRDDGYVAVLGLVGGSTKYLSGYSMPYHFELGIPSLRLLQRDDDNEFGSSRIERVQVSSAQKSGRIPGPNAYW